MSKRGKKVSIRQDGKKGKVISINGEEVTSARKGNSPHFGGEQKVNTNLRITKEKGWRRSFSSIGESAGRKREKQKKND